MEVSSMAREYHYLIAGLPDLLIDQDRKDFSLERLRAEMKDHLHPADYKQVEQLFLEFDNANFQNHIFNRNQQFNPDSTIPENYYAELDEHIGMFPSYIQEFYRYFKGGNEGDEDDDTKVYKSKVEKNPEVVFQEYFFSYMMGSGNYFISNWYGFLRDFNNVLTAINCRKQGIDVATQLVGEEELVDTLTRSQAADFGLKKEIGYLEQLLQIADMHDIMEREKRIDLLKWSKIDEIVTFDYFNIHAILAFLVKAIIVNRWLKLDAQIGSEMFKKMVNDLRESYSLPKEF
ncbi:MAG: DUF2764 family protein [Rikenellaceae bacterium]|nr:DUF2764 family protein [Rikenellaceae bacterium]